MIILFVLSFLTYKTSAEVYSSYENVKNINKIENHLVKLLNNYITEERERLQTLERFYHYVKSSKNYTTPDKYINYPTNQFNVIHRFVADWNNLDDWLTSKSEDLSAAFRTYRPYFPDDNDVQGAIKAISRLQDIYKISPAHFARGDPIVGEREDRYIEGQPLNVKALLLFIKNSYSNEDWSGCAGWGQQAYKQIQNREEYNPDTSLWFDIADHFSYCLYKAGHLAHAVEVTAEMLVHYPDHDRLIGNMAYFSKLVKEGQVSEEQSRAVRSIISEPLPPLDTPPVEGEEVEITFIPKKYPGGDETVLSEEEIEDRIQDRDYKMWGHRMKIYKKLCKEPPTLTPEIKIQLDRLTCYYKQNTPRSLMKPIKVEEAWPSPKILIFHDIISDDEADVLQDLAHPKLNRATVHNKNTGKLENAEYRVSKTAWLDEDLPEDRTGLVRKVNRRMEDATELSHEYAELQQVNNYGMAGQYEPHYDMAVMGEKAFEEHDGGNRVATLLFYMGTTDAGGATVFVDSGARMSPRKNAAVFWYNLLPSGVPDYLTRHAGCPVLGGTKWVMNKWFHVNDQMFTRPCGLTQYVREKEAKLYDGKYTVP